MANRKRTGVPRELAWSPTAAQAAKEMRMLVQWLRSLVNSRGRSAPAIRRRQPLTLEGLEERAVPAALYPIYDGSVYPSSAVCHIASTFPNGAVYWGTGTLVDPFHVLTAGHMTYNAAAGGWATEVTVTAGESFGWSPFGDAYATYERTYNSFINDSNINSNGHAPGDGDIGLLTLDRNLGYQTGWFGFGYNTDDNFYSGRGYNTRGYPAQAGYSGLDMYYQYGNISGTYPGTSSYFGALYWSTSQISAIPGQSGSGIYDYNGGNRRIDGIIETTTDPNNTGTGYGFAERITQGVFYDLVNWMNSDPQPISFQSAVQPASTLSAAQAAPTLTAQAYGDSGAAVAKDLVLESAVARTTLQSLTGDLAVGSASVVNATSPALTAGDSVSVKGQVASPLPQTNSADLVFVKARGHITSQALTAAALDDVFAQSSQSYNDAALGSVL
jgi:V8-like Glu-specific endopeptidase